MIIIYLGGERTGSYVISNVVGKLFEQTLAFPWYLYATTNFSGSKYTHTNTHMHIPNRKSSFNPQNMRYKTIDIHGLQIKKQSV